jgi:hypothetical protein
MTIVTTCPSTGFVPTDNYLLQGDCTIPGTFELMGNGSLSLSNGILTIYGNLVLMNNAYVSIFNGGIKFPQLGYSEYGIYMQNNAILDMTNSTFVTNNGTDDNYSMAINVYNEALVFFNQSSLNTNTGSWLLGNFYEDSKLMVYESLNLPTEIYPSDSSVMSIERSNFAGLWLNFNSGSAATIEVPTLNDQGVFSFTFGGTPGFDYFVSLRNSICRLSLNSYPNSTMILTNSETNINDPSKQVGLCFGYYFQQLTESIVTGNFTVGNNITQSFTDCNRLIQLENINLNPFTWQFYSSFTLPYSVTITNSLINELGCFQNSSVIVTDSVFQLAVLESYGPFAYLTINNSQIWSQAIEAFGESIMTITSSEIHGNFVQVDGVGSVMNFSSNTFDGHNGNATITNCNANSQGYTPNVNGVPLCNPYTPLHGCANVIVSDGGTLTRTPPCGAYPTMAPSQPPTNGTSWMPSFAPSRQPSMITTSMPTGSGGGGGGGNSAALSGAEVAGVVAGSVIGFAVLLIVGVYLLSLLGVNVSMPKMFQSRKNLEESGQVNLNNLPKSDQI